MADSNSTLGYGASVAFSELGVTFTEIAQTVDVGGPDPEIGDVDITNNDSDDNTKEYRPGMIEPGEQEFDIIYKKASATLIYGQFGDGKRYHWRITYPDGSTWTFKGYLKGFGTEAPTVDEAMRNTITIKLTSKPVFTAGS